MATAGGMGIWYILYLKHFERGGDLNENDLISELDLDYIHHLIVLCDLNNDFMKRGGVIEIIQ